MVRLFVRELSKVLFADLPCLREPFTGNEDRDKYLPMERIWLSERNPVLPLAHREIHVGNRRRFRSSHGLRSGRAVEGTRTAG